MAFLLADKANRSRLQQLTDDNKIKKHEKSQVKNWLIREVSEDNFLNTCINTKVIALDKHRKVNDQDQQALITLIN